MNTPSIKSSDFEGTAALARKTPKLTLHTGGAKHTVVKQSYIYKHNFVDNFETIAEDAFITKSQTLYAALLFSICMFVLFIV